MPTPDIKLDLSNSPLIREIQRDKETKTNQSRGLDFLGAPENPDNIIRATTSRRTFGVPFEEYTDYGVTFGVLSNPEKERAVNQSGWEQFGRTFGNMLTANIGLQIISDFANIPEMFDPQQDYSNAVTRWVEKVKNPWGEVYRENPNETWDMGDPAWWYTNGGQLVESIAAFAVETYTIAGLAGKVFGGLAKLGKAATLANNASKIAKVVGESEKLYQLTRMAGKLATIDKAANTASFLTTTFGTGYLEAAQIGGETYKNVYAYQKSIGTNEDDARLLAGQGAALATKINTVGIGIFNMTGISSIFKNNSLGSIAKEIGLTKTLKEAEEVIAKKGLTGVEAINLKLNILKGFIPDIKQRNIYKKLGWEMFQEGALEEGGVNTIAQYLGEQKGGMHSDEKLIDTLFSSENALQAVLGAIGGLGQSGAIELTPSHRYKNDAGKVSRETGRHREARLALGNSMSLVGLYKDDLERQIKLNTQLSNETDPDKRRDIQEQIWTITANREILQGTADNLINSFKAIQNIDNVADLGEQLQPEIEAISKQIEAISKVESTPETAATLERLTKTRDELIVKQKDLIGKTAAMVAGFAESKEDNNYKTKAIQKITQARELADQVDTIRNAFKWDTDEELAGMGDHLATLHVTNYSLNERIKLLEDRKSHYDSKIVRFGNIPYVDEAITIQDELKANQKATQYAIDRLEELQKPSGSDEEATFMATYGGTTGNEAKERAIKNYEKQITEGEKRSTELFEKLDANEKAYKDSEYGKANPTKYNEVLNTNSAYRDGKVRIDSMLIDLKHQKLANEKAYNEMTTASGRKAFVNAWKNEQKRIQAIIDKQADEKEAVKHKQTERTEEGTATDVTETTTKEDSKAPGRPVVLPSFPLSGEEANAETAPGTVTQTATTAREVRAIEDFNKAATEFLEALNPAEESFEDTIKKVESAILHNINHITNNIPTTNLGTDNSNAFIAVVEQLSSGIVAALNKGFVTTTILDRIDEYNNFVIEEYSLIIDTNSYRNVVRDIPVQDKIIKQDEVDDLVKAKLLRDLLDKAIEANVITRVDFNTKDDVNIYNEDDYKELARYLNTLNPTVFKDKYIIFRKVFNLANSKSEWEATLNYDEAVGIGKTVDTVENDEDDITNDKILASESNTDNFIKHIDKIYEPNVDDEGNIILNFDVRSVDAYNLIAWLHRDWKWGLKRDKHGVPIYGKVDATDVVNSFPGIKLLLDRNSINVGTTLDVKVDTDYINTSIVDGKEVVENYSTLLNKGEKEGTPWAYIPIGLYYQGTLLGYIHDPTFMNSDNIIGNTDTNKTKVLSIRRPIWDNRTKPTTVNITHITNGHLFKYADGVRKLVSEDFGSNDIQIAIAKGTKLVTAKGVELRDGVDDNGNITIIHKPKIIKGIPYMIVPINKIKQSNGTIVNVYTAIAVRPVKLSSRPEYVDAITDIISSLTKGESIAAVRNEVGKFIYIKPTEGKVTLHEYLDTAPITANYISINNNDSVDFGGGQGRNYYSMYKVDNKWRYVKVKVDVKSGTIAKTKINIKQKEFNEALKALLGELNVRVSIASLSDTNFVKSNLTTTVGSYVVDGTTHYTVQPSFTFELNNAVEESVSKEVEEVTEEETVTVDTPTVSQQTTYDCGVACLSTALAALGDVAPIEELTKEVKPNKFSGASLNSIKKVAINRGYESTIDRKSTLLDIKEALDESKQVILLIEGIGTTKENTDYSKYKNGHYIIVKSFDDTGFTLGDPTEKEDIFVSNEDLMTRWHGYNDNGTKNKQTMIVIGKIEKVTTELLGNISMDEDISPFNPDEYTTKDSEERRKYCEH